MHCKRPYLKCTPLLPGRMSKAPTCFEANSWAVTCSKPAAENPSMKREWRGSVLLQWKCLTHQGLDSHFNAMSYLDGRWHRSAALLGRRWAASAPDWAYQEHLYEGADTSRFSAGSLRTADLVLASEKRSCSQDPCHETSYHTGTCY